MILSCKDKNMKQVIIILFCVLSFILPIFSDETSKLEAVISVYGYEVSVYENNVSNKVSLIIETDNKNFTKHTSSIFVTATSRALIKFIELYKFDIMQYGNIHFVSGEYTTVIQLQAFLKMINSEQSRQQFLQDRAKSLVDKSMEW